MLITFAILVALISVMPRREVSNVWVNALRVCFPSWRFFGAPGLDVDLLWRVEGSDDTERPWRSALRTTRRGFGSLLWNPNATVRLAEESLVRAAIADIEGLDEATPQHTEALVSVQLLRALIERQLRAHVGVPAPSTTSATPLRYELVVRSRSIDEPTLTDHLRLPTRVFEESLSGMERA